MITVTVNKRTWDQAWVTAGNRLKVRETQARHDFGPGAGPVIERLVRAAEEILAETRRGFEE